MTTTRTIRGPQARPGYTFLRPGYTFLELLATLGIILILLAVLTPVFLQTRNDARRTGCASNLSQIGIAVHLYAQDYSGALPPANDALGATMPQIKNYGVLTCPMDLDPQSARMNALQSVQPGVAPYSSYRVRGGLSTDDDPMTALARDRQPWHNGANVLYLDGRVEWISRSRLKSIPMPGE